MASCLVEISILVVHTLSFWNGPSTSSTILFDDFDSMLLSSLEFFTNVDLPLSAMKWELIVHTSFDRRIHKNGTENYLNFLAKTRLV